MQKNDLIEVRPYREADYNFIIATFLRALYHGNYFFGEIHKDIFMRNYSKVIDAIIKSSHSNIKIACLKEDADVILGYSILNKSETVVHFVFSKSAWRAIGVARSLVPNTVKEATHFTKIGLSIIKKKGLTFNPFAVNL